MAVTVEPPWPAGPARPLLAVGAVHVWQADLRTVGEDLGGLLSPSERERTERFVHTRDGELWAHSRGLLRELLGRYLHSDPRRLRIGVGPHGKPALLQQRGVLELSFNLSHSGEIALFAFSAAGGVGVDVELGRRRREVVAVARRAFGADAARALALLDAARREREFLRLWVRREAALKSLGVGLAGEALAGRVGERWIAELEIGPHSATAAVALAAAPAQLRCWELPLLPAIQPAAAPPWSRAASRACAARCPRRSSSRPGRRR